MNMLRQKKYLISLAILFVLLSFATQLFFSRILNAESEIYSFTEISGSKKMAPKIQLNENFAHIGKVKAELLVNVFLPRIPRKMDVLVDDCLEELSINNFKYAGSNFPQCNAKKYREFTLPPKLFETAHPFNAIWKFQLKVENKQDHGKAHIKLKPTKEVELLLRVIQMLFGLTGIFLVAWIYKAPPKQGLDNESI